MLDPQGRNQKCRTGVIVSPTGGISDDESFVVAAVTSTYREPLAADEIKLPWNRDRTKVRTGLTRPVVVKCSWLVAIEPTDVEAVAGELPLALLTEVLDRIRHLGET